MNKSKFLSLNVHDFLKGAIVAVLTPTLVLIQEILSDGLFDLDAKKLLAVGLSGFTAYLLKNFFEGKGVEPVSLKANVLASGEEEDGEGDGLVGSRPTDRERNKKRD
jgi:hypothetical protein